MKETGTVKWLLAQTLLGDYESEEAWAAVSALRMDGSHEIRLWLLGLTVWPPIANRQSFQWIRAGRNPPPLRARLLRNRR